MTPTTQTVFEKYQVRKTKKQKQAFRDFVLNFSKDNGYDCRIEKAMFGSKNIVIGNPDTAKVIYTAHYDTCAALPFPNFITPLRFDIYLLYQIALLLIIFAVMFALSFVLGWLLGLLGASTLVAVLAGELANFAILALLFFGPANKQTANDNTSGVTALLDLMTAVPKEHRDSVAFIFFDNEELGLLGSSSYSSQHKKTLKETLLINFDCISDGNNILFAVQKTGAHFIPLLEQTFVPNEVYSVKVLTKGVFYPSDQKNFPCGVGVAALKKSKRFSVEYMDRIHTKRDTVYEEQNIAYLVEGCLRLNWLLKNQDSQ